MLGRLAQFCYRRRRFVLLGWVVIFFGLGAAQGVAGSNFHTEFRLPNTESRAGFDLLAQGNDEQGYPGQIVFRTDAGVTDPAVQSAMTKFFGDISAFQRSGHQIRVVSPYDPAGQNQVASAGPEAGKLAYAQVDFPRQLSQGEIQSIANDVEKAAPEVPGLTIEYGGDPFSKFKPPSSETLGLTFAIFILIVSFGSILAMGLPIGVALAGIGSGVAITTLLSHVMSMPDFTTTLAAMIGLGVGIDYALFIVTRYREGIHQGWTPERSTVVAIDTAGRAVLFAGTTVVISLLGMFLMGLSFVRGLAVGASVTVLMTMLASITLLPALLGFAKHRIELTRYRGLISVSIFALGLLFIGLKAPWLVGFGFIVLAVLTLLASFAIKPMRREVPRRAAKPIRETFWYKWSRIVQHRPWRALLGGLVILVVLLVPVTQLRLGFSDHGNDPSGQTTRKAYDLLARGFGPGSNGPLFLVSDVPAGTDPAVIDKITKAVQTTPGVAAAVARPADVGGTIVSWFVVPTTSPQDEATTTLVHHLRDDILPSLTTGTNVKVLVTGSVAANIDFSDFISRRLPIFVGAVLALSFILLMTVFRSLLVPHKAVIVNLLSIGAAYGIVVAVFHWGWGASALGVGKGGPIDAWAPMMLFAIVFGLSMDYEVFLLSRIREEYDRTGDNATAVADGLAATARVITAAAAIMVFVFGSFLLEVERPIKLFGLGLALAVLLDATVVRMVLVPATMELLGDRNWWFPKWLDKILPKLNVEGHVATDLDRELADLVEQEATRPT
jgi:RND superfamily putative drug exporter